MKIIIMLTGFLLALNANATGQLSDKQMYGYCETLAEVSETVMIQRQSGSSLSKLLKVSNDRFVREIVYKAFEEPRLESIKEKIAVDFRNKTHLDCINKYIKNK